MAAHLLRPADRVSIEELRGNTRDKGSYMKLSVLVMLDEGLDYDTSK